MQIKHWLILVFLISCIKAVSYTHLDVYKRQLLDMLLAELVLSLYLFKFLACINKQNIVIFFTALLKNTNTSRNTCAIENICR